MAKKSGLLVSAFIIGILIPRLEVSAQVRSIIFPVSGKASFRDDFSEPRGGGTREHLGIDIIADKMTPVVSATDGEITFIAIPQASWGYAITITDSEGYSYRYLHLNNDTPGTDDGQGGPANAYAPNLQRGTNVTRGQVIGFVGDSGNAENTTSHLHFEIFDRNRVHINPYQSLLLASGGTASQSTSVVVHGNLVVSTQEEEKFIAQRSLQEGMTDKDVATLHTELKALGYYSGSISNTYNSATREAVRNFQNANKIFATGIADVETRNAITSASKLVPGVKVTTTTTISGGSSLKLDYQGEEVRKLQIKLKELGFFTADVTGYFGPITEKAVKAFQIANKIEPLGIVGPKTKLALEASGKTTFSYVFKNLLQKGSRGEEVKNLQILLKDRGYFDGDVTNYFGAQTMSAVIAFQKANNIEPLGIVGPKTRSVLNNL